MYWVNRVPIWAWFLITTALCYAYWNPTNVSLWHWVFASDALASVKVLVAILSVSVLLLYLLETGRSLGKIGLALMGAFLLALSWVCYDTGILRTDNVSSVRWWGQIVVGFVLTVGLQGGRMYRAVTGRVPVAGTETVVTDHHSTHH